MAKRSKFDTALTRIDQQIALLQAARAVLVDWGEPDPPAKVAKPRAAKRDRSGAGAVHGDAGD